MKDDKNTKPKKKHGGPKDGVVDQSQYKVEDTSELVLKSQLARALADYDNLRRRVEQEKGAWVKFATQRVISRLLPTLDMLETAQKHLNDQGLTMAVNEFKKVLIDEDLIEIIPEVGVVFDHDLHEAVEVVEGEDGKVAEVVQTGWKFKDGNIVRPAKVKVGKKSIADSQ